MLIQPVNDKLQNKHKALLIWRFLHFIDQWLQKANNMYNMKILFVLCIAFLQPSEGMYIYYYVIMYI